MINNITDEERQALEQLRDEQQQQQQHRQSRTKRLAEMKSALRRSGEQPDEGRLRITTRGDAQEQLMWALVRKVGDRAQWPDEYDQIAAWLSDNQGKGLMLIGDCGRGKSLITTEILPEMFSAGLIIDAQTRSTQAILDKLCALELDGVKNQLAQAQRDNLGLQNQLNMAAFRESQANQNTLISQGFANEVDALYNRLSNCPVPSTPVYGRTPIFTCPQNVGGCGGTGVGFAA